MNAPNWRNTYPDPDAPLQTGWSLLLHVLVTATGAVVLTAAICGIVALPLLLR